MGKIIDLKAVIGIYPVCNTGSLLVHKIDYAEDRVLVSLNGEKEEWCEMTEGHADASGELEYGFYWGKMFVPFADVMRMTSPS